MDNEPEEVIRHQMAETRTALKDKLETLEQQVKDTVEGATEAVETVKETVKETVENVKETVEETVQSVKETFNLSKHVQDYPWPAFACATLVGFMGGRLLNRAYAENEPGTATAPLAAPGLYHNGGSSPPASSPAAARSWWSWVADHYKEELNKVKGLAVATAAGVVRDMVSSEVSPEFGERVKEVIDGITIKLGGEPIKGPILKPASRETPKEKTPEQDFGPRWQRSAQVPPR